MADGVDDAGALEADLRQRLLDPRLTLAATPELQEREGMKLARLAALTAAQLEDGGVPPTSASAAAALGALVLRLADDRWASSPEGRPLASEMSDVLATVRGLVLSG